MYYLWPSRRAPIGTGYLQQRTLHAGSCDLFNRIDEYIYLDYTRDTTEEGLPVYRYVQNDATICGMEGIAENLPVNWQSIKTAFSYTRGKQSSSVNLPFIYHNRLRSEIR